MSKWIELEKEDGTSYIIPANSIVAAESYEDYRTKVTRVYVKGLQLHIKYQEDSKYKLTKPEGDIEIIEVATDIKTLSFLLPMVEKDTNV